MAETVQYYLERMIPELEDLEKHEVFSKVGHNVKKKKLIIVIN
jgi:hypothetical protein